jgi:hypothetical protein
VKIGGVEDWHVGEGYIGVRILGTGKSEEIAVGAISVGFRSIV